MRTACSWFTTIGLLLTLISATRIHADPNQINWRKTSLGKVIQEASAVNKPIFLVMKSETCGNSRHFLSESLQHPDTIKYINSRFIPLLADKDSDTEVASQYQIFAWPGILVLKPNGEEVDRVRPWGSPMIVNVVEELVTHGKTLPELEADLANSPGSFEFKREILYKSLRRFDVEKALQYEQLIQKMHPSEFAASEEAMIWAFGDAYSLSGTFEKAIERYTNILSMPGADYQSAFRMISIEHFVQNHLDEGFNVLRNGMSKMPNSPLLHFFFIASALQYEINLREAILLGERILKLQIDSLSERSSILAILAQAYQKLCLLPQARQRIQEAIRTDSQNTYYPEILKDIEESGACLAPEVPQ